MPEYRRLDAPGASVFFTVVTDRRRPILASVNSIVHLRGAFRLCLQRLPFTIDAISIMPEHIHALWTMPRGDDQIGRRWSLIKAVFTRAFLADGAMETRRVNSRMKRGERGVWQRRFWDHVIRDDDDFGRHVDYIYYNPVKHGLVRCPHDWPYSSFHNDVKSGRYAADWMCLCRRPNLPPPDFCSLKHNAGE